MKKFYFVLIFVFAVGINNANAQLEVIDKVAEVLIPGITNGIKSVMESSNGKKVKKEEVEKLKTDLMSSTKSIVSNINNDVSNISALNGLFNTTGALFDNIGSMKTMTNQMLLSEILSTNSHTLYRETAIQFGFHWRQVEAKKDKLVSSTKDASSGSVQDDIAQYVAILDENLISLETAIGLAKKPSSDMDLPTSKTYIENLKRAEPYIKNIDDAVKAINVQISSRIKSLNKSLIDAQKKIEEMTKTEE